MWKGIPAVRNIDTILYINKHDMESKLSTWITESESCSSSYFLLSLEEKKLTAFTKMFRLHLWISVHIRECIKPQKHRHRHTSTCGIIQLPQTSTPPHIWLWFHYVNVLFFISVLNLFDFTHIGLYNCNLFSLRYSIL